RKSAIEEANVRAFKSFQGSVLDEVGAMDTSLDAFSDRSSSLLQNLVSEIEAFRNCSAETTRQRGAQLDADLDSLQARSSELADRCSASKAELAGELHRLVERMRASHDDAAAAEATRLENERGVLGGVARRLDDMAGMIQTWSRGLQTQLGAFFECVRASFEEQARMQAAHNSALCESYEAQISKLNAHVQQLQSAELRARQQSEQMEADAVARMTELVASFAAGHRRAYASLAADATGGVGTTVLPSLREAQVSFGDDAARIAAALDNGRVAAETASAALLRTVTDLQEESGHKAADIAADLVSVTAAAEAAAKAATTTAHAAAHDVTEAGAALVGKVGASAESMASGISLFAEAEAARVETAKTQRVGDGLELDEAAVRWMTSVGTARDDLETFALDQREQVRRVCSEADRDLVTVDRPTGKTPRKRTFAIPAELVRTRDHADLLREFRETGHHPLACAMPAPIQSALQQWQQQNVAATAKVNSGDENEDPSPFIVAAPMMVGGGGGGAHFGKAPTAASTVAGGGGANGGGPGSRLPRSRQVGTLRFSDSPFRDPAQER
ncbi:hypothetical protein HK405_008895, partial [Cladochytrium tenue]